MRTRRAAREESAEASLHGFDLQFRGRPVDVLTAQEMVVILKRVQEEVRGVEVGFDVQKASKAKLAEAVKDAGLDIMRIVCEKGNDALRKEPVADTPQLEPNTNDLLFEGKPISKMKKAELYTAVGRVAVLMMTGKEPSADTPFENILVAQKRLGKMTKKELAQALAQIAIEEMSS